MNRRLAFLTAATVAVCSIGARPPVTATGAPAVGPQEPRTAPVVPQVTPAGMLALGARGEAVTDLQERFARWGYTITVDGWFGPQTAGVVQRWQRSNGITVDGIVGPETTATFHVADALAGTAGAAAGTGAERSTPVADPPQTVEEMIRSVWPDDLEERALVIAHRESRFVPTARNYCCHGIFQMYWSVHRGWLDDFGVTTLEQLYDPMINVRMAYELYKRAGGWAPWSQTDPGA